MYIYEMVEIVIKFIKKFILIHKNLDNNHGNKE
jgi:hypothetical protein